MAKAIIFYHGNCPDGFTSAWAAWKHFGDSAEYIPCFHDKQHPFFEARDRDIYYVDYCPKDEEFLRELARDADNVCVLDHHATVKDMVEGLIDEGVIAGDFDMNRSGAMIAWEWFHPDTEPPVLVHYIQDQDLWRFQLPNSQEINMNILSYEYTFENWEKISNECLTQINNVHYHRFLEGGQAILRKLLKDCDEIMTQEMTLKIAGIDVPTFNANYFYGSHLCNRYITTKGGNVAAYFWINKEGKYNFGLRSSKDGPNVAKMAESYGGGGHVQASGFRVDSLKDL